MRGQFVLGVLVTLAFCGSVVAAPVDLTPLVSVADESGFGTLYDSLAPQAFVSEYSTYSGTITSRVYTDTPDLPANAVTFVWDVMMDGTSILPVEDMAIASTGAQLDLRIAEIIAGTNGYVSGTTTNIPDTAEATDNVFPTVDDIFYEWIGANLLGANDRATLYVTTTAEVDIGQINVALQNAGGSSALILAPVDDPNNPDMNVPEPASIALFLKLRDFFRGVKNS